MSPRISHAALKSALLALGDPPPPPEPATRQGMLVAAVAAVVTQREPIEVLLIRRAASEGDPWSAHMAFPGGKFDPSDQSLLVTAARETREEVGLDLFSQAEYLGALPVQAFSRQNRQLHIQPFVFALLETPRLDPNHEVDGVYWVSLESLLDGSRTTSIFHENNGLRMKFPAWDVDGNAVWGLTYRMLGSLLSLLQE